MIFTSECITGIALAICIVNVACIVKNKREFNARKRLKQLRLEYPNLSTTLQEYENEKEQKQKIRHFDAICIGKAVYHNDEIVHWGNEKNENGPNVRLVYFLDFTNNFYSIINTHIYQMISQKDIDNKTVFHIISKGNKIIAVKPRDNENS